MSAPINDGGPAFPHFKFSENGKVEICPQGGMTLRDYLAGQAMQGLIASGKLPEDTTSNSLAEFSYSNADAMLRARKEVTK